MAVEKPISVADAYSSVQPKIRDIGTKDVIDALSKGIDLKP